LSNPVTTVEKTDNKIETTGKETGDTKKDSAENTEDTTGKETGDTKEDSAETTEDTTINETGDTKEDSAENTENINEKKITKNAIAYFFQKGTTEQKYTDAIQDIENILNNQFGVSFTKAETGNFYPVVFMIYAGGTRLTESIKASEVQKARTIGKEVVLIVFASLNRSPNYTGMPKQLLLDKIIAFGINRSGGLRKLNGQINTDAIRELKKIIEKNFQTTFDEPRIEPGLPATEIEAVDAKAPESTIEKTKIYASDRKTEITVESLFTANGTDTVYEFAKEPNIYEKDGSYFIQIIDNSGHLLLQPVVGKFDLDQYGDIELERVTDNVYIAHTLTI
jgi:hypothetical protein